MTGALRMAEGESSAPRRLRDERRADPSPPLSRTCSSAVWGLKSTFSGLLCAAIALLVGLAALNIEANLLFLLFGISVGVVCVSAVLPLRQARRIEVLERVVPDAVVAGRPFTIVYVLRNRSRWLRSWSLNVRETPVGGAIPGMPQGFVAVIQPGETRRIELRARCAHRGRVVLRGVRVTSRYPFGLFACEIDVSLPAEIVTYPVLGRLRRDPWKPGRHFASSSRKMARSSAGQDEFFGVREYREGDNPRWVHWRRSAHTGQLVVREMTPVRTTQLIVLVDPWQGEQPKERRKAGRREGWGVGRWDRRRRRRSAEQRDSSEIERIISLAATAVCDGLERGHRVGLVCSAAVPVVIPPAGGRAHRQRLLHELALAAPPAAETPVPEPLTFEELVSRIRWSSGWQARCLLCVTKLDEPHQRVARFLERHAEALLVVTPNSEMFEALMAVPPLLVGGNRGVWDSAGLRGPTLQPAGFGAAVGHGAATPETPVNGDSAE